MKTRLSSHLKSANHVKKVNASKTADEEVEKYDKREGLVGKRIGRICYYLFKLGRPDTDFEPLVYLHFANQSDIRDIDHSKNFPPKVLLFMSNEVDRLKKSLACPLEQTGFRPTGKIGADKATWKHSSRQFVTFTTVVPDLPDLLHVFFLGHHVVKHHNGDGVTESIANCLQKYDINQSQYLGGSFDGAYFFLGIPDKLGSYPGLSGNKKKHRDWDPLLNQVT